ncbi:hypothetical protein B1400_0909 [Bifidobacterium italicum]|uniref:UrcA family protein n=1 Tax=Bifidobacterium italicum TaxID=1960968 RepID=A0A2A2EKC9_9BIFI|nr:hypothetical protein B1400_0909 [Bifidobacterium italicum]
MVRIPHTKQTKKAVGGSAACLMTLGLVFGSATTAHAQQNGFTPYFRNSDVRVGDVHVDVLARDDASKMVASSRSRGSYCEASQDTNRKIRDISDVGKTCGAAVLASQSIKSAGDYACCATR